jgi:hypothetical protein
VTIEFKAWPKTPRLFRDIVITEKVDGTNSAIIIEELDVDDPGAHRLAAVERDGVLYEVGAQSRNRLILPGKTTDNHGFAAFVQHNAERLFDLLGPGRHYGEWWGEGIQGRYKFPVGTRGFALFNTQRHEGLHEWLEAPDGKNILVETVPVLYKGPFSEKVIRDTLEVLRGGGSCVSPTDKSEGIVVFHTQSRQVYKYTIEGDDAHKEALK